MLRISSAGLALAKSVGAVAPRSLSAAAPHIVRGKHQAITSKKAWTTANLDRSLVFRTAPADVASELKDNVLELLKTVKNNNVDEAKVDISNLPKTKAYMSMVEDKSLVNGPGFAVMTPIPGIDTIHQRRMASLVITSVMGEPLVQNAEGHKSVLVYDRDASKKMIDGQRYHQSHEGGSLHTDNVNVPDTWEHMLLTCLQPSAIGGENIIVSAVSVYNYMAERVPEAIDILSEDFWWEFRGFSDKFYRAPILFYNTMGEPCFRYLREYMESAHVRLKDPLTRRQVWALDLIDTIADLSELQFRHTFSSGEILLTNDLHILHGRTTFIDAAAATKEYNFENPVNRLMQRNWLRTYNTAFRGMNQSKYTIPEDAIKPKAATA